MPEHTLDLRAASLADTHAIASAVASLARAGDIIVLAGEMGAGKTAFAQGFGRALGVDGPITSPTFTLVHSYDIVAGPGAGKLRLHHADLYRLDRTGDIDDLALHELAEFDGIVLIEWGDVAGGAIGDHLEVRLAAGDDDAWSPEPADETSGEPPADDPPPDEFGLDGRRTLEIAASGPGWAGRWDRVTAGLAGFLC